MPKAFYCVTGASVEGQGAKVEYSVVVFDTPAAEEFSSDCKLLSGLTGLQTSMLIASKVTQDVLGRGHLVITGQVFKENPVPQNGDEWIGLLIKIVIGVAVFFSKDFNRSNALLPMMHAQIPNNNGVPPILATISPQGAEILGVPRGTIAEQPLEEMKP